MLKIAVFVTYVMSQLQQQLRVNPVLQLETEKLVSNFFFFKQVQVCLKQTEKYRPTNNITVSTQYELLTVCHEYFWHSI